MSYANNKGADKPAHSRSLISAFVVHCLDSVMSRVSVTKISSLMLAPVAEQVSLSLTWSETPEDTFSHDEAELHYIPRIEWQTMQKCMRLSFAYHVIAHPGIWIDSPHGRRNGEWISHTKE